MIVTQLNYPETKIVRGATQVLAAYDSSGLSKAQADYVCIGVNDHEVIQKAYNAPGKVVWLEGTYNLADQVTIPSNCWTEFQGVTINYSKVTDYALYPYPNKTNVLFTGHIKKADGGGVGGGYAFCMLGGTTDRNCIWEAHIDELTGFTTYGFNVYLGNHIAIKNVRLVDQIHGIYTNGARHLLLENINLDYTTALDWPMVFVYTGQADHLAYDAVLRGFTIDGGGVCNKTPVVIGSQGGTAPFYRDIVVDGYYARNFPIDSLNLIKCNGFTINHHHSYKTRGLCLVASNGRVSNSTAVKSENHGFSAEEGACSAICKKITFVNCSAVDCGQKHLVSDEASDVGFSIYGASGYVMEDISFIGCSAYDEQSGMSSLLTANAASGQKDVVVADASVFDEGQAVTISDDTPLTESNFIVSIDTSTNTLTMENALTNAYTTAQNALVSGRATQKYGISAHSYFDGITIKGCDLQGNSIAPVYVGTTGATKKITSDRTIHSLIMDLSDAAEDIAIYHPNSPAQILKLTFVFTEATSADAACTMRVGKEGDDNYYYTGDSWVSTGQWEEGNLVQSEAALLKTDIAVGDTVTVGHTQKVGGGKVMFILEIVEMA